MTKLPKATKKNDVQTHINAAYACMDEHLPTQYAGRTLRKLRHLTDITEDKIRNVRLKKNTAPENNLEVVNALLEVALENKAQKEKLQSQVS